MRIFFEEMCTGLSNIGHSRLNLYIMTHNNVGHDEMNVWFLHFLVAIRVLFLAVGGAFEQLDNFYI